METRLLRVTDQGTEECVCRLEGSDLVMELRLAGQKPRTTRKTFGSDTPERYSPPADWHYPQLVHRKLSEGFVLFERPERAGLYDAIFRAADGSSRFDLHPDGRSVLFALFRSEAYGVDFHVLDFKTGRSRIVHGEEFDHANPRQTWVRDIRYHPDGQSIYFTMNNATLKLSLQRAKRRVVVQSEGKLVARNRATVLFPGNRSDARIEMDAERTRLLAYSEQGSEVRVLSTDDDRVIFEQGTWPPKFERHTTAAISPSGKRVAIADASNTLVVFDVASGKEVTRVTLSHKIRHLTFSPNEDRLFVSPDWGRVGPFVYAIGSSEPLFEFKDEGEYPEMAEQWAFAPDGKTVVLAGKRIRLADVNTGKELKKLEGGAGRLVFSRDGRLLVSGGGGTEVRKATAEPFDWPLPEVSPTAKDAKEARGFDATALLREWDGMHGGGEFPCGEGYFGDKFDHWDARLEVFAKWEGEDSRYVVVFQVIGEDRGAASFGNSLFAIGDRVDWPAREMEGNATITCPQQARVTDNYSLSDAEARAEDVDYVAEPQDPAGDWARLQRFKVRLDETEYELTPTREDYARAGIEVTDRQYQANLTIALSSIAKLANHLLQDKIWVQDPLSLPGLMRDFSKGPYTRIYFEEGVDVVSHVSKGGAPSTHPRWQKIARLLAAGKAEEVRADMDLVEAAVRAEYFPQKPLDQPLTDLDCAAVVSVKLNDDRRASDLSFLRRLPNVRLLWLFRTQVTDLSPLAGLPHLEELNLAGCPVADLSPIAHCPKLRRLTISHTRVADLGPLTGLEALMSLDVEGTPISDLSPLRGQTELRELFLDNTEVKTLAPLRGLELVRLFMQRTDVTDVSPLAKMQSLRVLTLPPTVKSIDSLRGLFIYDELVEKRAAGSGAMASRYVR